MICFTMEARTAEKSPGLIRCDVFTADDNSPLVLGRTRRRRRAGTLVFSEDQWKAFHVAWLTGIEKHGKALGVDVEFIMDKRVKQLL